MYLSLAALVLSVLALLVSIVAFISMDDYQQEQETRRGRH